MKIDEAKLTDGYRLYVSEQDLTDDWRFWCGPVWMTLHAEYAIIQINGESLQFPFRFDPLYAGPLEALAVVARRAAVLARTSKP